ncbi:hypothetical protein H1W00_12335 [Aeromicrobium sp. Marseille-Q0843]|uniref:Uncharacterized protein n=1 Tax=Aeromicrobium phoceense TaxID=2754045 RepID=A0A838XCS9_9ACTN|nr:hypothetical protein [Aeromicrobium phoceense]MBA4609269.1 hypothetical protein [Aeromicrobium phoceense]
MSYEVPLSLTNFPKWVPNPQSLLLSDELLVWAAATLGERGRAPFSADIVRAGHRRVSTLYDAFSTTCGCHLAPSQNYLSGSDTTERATISYFLGGLSAKLAAALLVGVPYLTHYDAVLREHGRPVRGRRPDFVGVGNPPIGARVTVEAKGTIGNINNALDYAAVQAKGAGRRPRPRRLVWGQQAHFNDHGWGEAVWSASLVDPPEDDFEFPATGDVLVAYFAPLVRDLFFRAQVESYVESQGWWMAELGETGAQVAIRREIALAALESDGAALVELSRLHMNGPDDREPQPDEVEASLLAAESEHWGSPIWPERADLTQGIVGPDGIAVRTSTVATFSHSL